MVFVVCCTHNKRRTQGRNLPNMLLVNFKATTYDAFNQFAILQISPYHGLDIENERPLRVI